MKISLMSLFILLFTTGLSAQTFTYDLHDNTGEGKLDRLNGIESFLNKLDSNLKLMNKNINSERAKENLVLQHQIEEIKEKDLKDLATKVSEIEKNLGELKKEFSELKKKVEDDGRTEKINEEQLTMKKEVGDLKASLKSIQELMKVYESLGNRGKPIN